jgi:hypothetical protein
MSCLILVIELFFLTIIIIIIIISVSSQLSPWILKSNSVGVVHACVRLTYLPDEGYVAMEH